MNSNGDAELANVHGNTTEATEICTIWPGEMRGRKTEGGMKDNLLKYGVSVKSNACC